MTRPTNTEIRGKILAAAEAIVAESGHETLNMRDVASRLGITATTIYRYFKNRKDLLLAVELEAARRLQERIESVDRSLPAGEYLVRMGREYVEFAQSNPRLYALLVEDVSGEVEPDKDELRILYKPYLMAKDVLVAAQNVSPGSRGPADPTGEALMGWIMLHGFSSLIISGRLQLAEGMSEERLKELFFSYYGRWKS